MSSLDNHRARWMRRISKAETKSKVMEDKIHDVLDYIEDNDLNNNSIDNIVYAKLLEIVKSI